MKRSFFIASEVMPAKLGTRSFRIVLHESSADGELVVHHQNMREGEGAEFYWGHYHPGALVNREAGAEALRDYVDTCAKYRLNPSSETPGGIAGEGARVTLFELARYMESLVQQCGKADFVCAESRAVEVAASFLQGIQTRVDLCQSLQGKKQAEADELMQDIMQAVAYVEAWRTARKERSDAERGPK